MKTKTIKRGNHYCSPFPVPKIILLGNMEKELYISFDDSCKYVFNDLDLYDINKLFGFSYGYHHYNSDRIGWRYLVDEDVFELLTYSYVNGVRISPISLGKVNANEIFRVEINTTIKNGKRFVVFELNDRCVAKEYKVSKVWIKYTLGLYFGGNTTAPHTMKVNYYKI